MKNGRITRQGTFGDIVRQDPELHRQWEQDVIAATETEVSSSGISDGETERETLKKQVIRIKQAPQEGASLAKAEIEKYLLWRLNKCYQQAKMPWDIGKGISLLKYVVGMIRKLPIVFRRHPPHFLVNIVSSFSFVHVLKNFYFFKTLN